MLLEFVFHRKLSNSRRSKETLVRIYTLQKNNILNWTSLINLHSFLLMLFVSNVFLQDLQLNDLVGIFAFYIIILYL